MHMDRLTLIDGNPCELSVYNITVATVQNHWRTTVCSLRSFVLVFWFVCSGIKRVYELYLLRALV